MAKWCALAVGWVLSLVAVAAWAQQTRSNVPVVISGGDVGFRVEAWDGSVPTGRWVVRSPLAPGEWVEPRVATTLRPLQ